MAHRCPSAVAVMAVLAAPSAVARQANTAAGTRPAFEAATIKLAPPGVVRSNRVISTSPNRMFIPGMPLSSPVLDRSDGTLGPNVQKWSGSCPAVRPALYLEAPCSLP